MQRGAVDEARPAETALAVYSLDYHCRHDGMFRALVCETGPADREGKFQIVARYLALRRSG